MKYGTRILIGAYWSFVIVSSPAQLQAGDTPKCRELRPLSDSDQHALVRQSGCYKLSTSFDQRWLYSIPEGGRRGPHTQELIMVWAPNVVIDLESRSLATTTWIDGVTLNLEEDPEGKRINKNSRNGEEQLEIRNGTINLVNDRLRESGLSGRGVIAPEQLTYIHARYRNANPMPSVFPKVRYVLENLKIRTENSAAMLMGDGIVIRNCTIEVEGENALVIYGPNALIENNRIVFRYRSPIKPGNPSYPVAAAAIYLRAADGARVRGNTIELDSTDSSVAGVAVVDSHGVTVEGNRFNRDSELVVRRGSSTVEFRGNTMKVGWPRKDRLLPDVKME